MVNAEHGLSWASQPHGRIAARDAPARTQGMLQRMIHETALHLPAAHHAVDGSLFER